MEHKQFIHQQHAHCESGVTANLLRHCGMNISEPMAFGIGAGIFFGHLPFLKVGGIPGTTYRIWPGAIFKRVAAQLKTNVTTQRFGNPQKAMDALDAALEQNKPVGILGSVFYLPYLPEAFRFHFNAHNLVVYGKENGQYLVSDPILETTATIAPTDLVKARFAKGTPEPSGFMYFINDAGNTNYLKEAIFAGIKQTCFFMLSPPIPYFGNKAIFLLANRVKIYPAKLGARRAGLYLGNIIRMQEEIGTGGAGFRYLFAAFLQEAGETLHNNALLDYAKQMTEIGDQWRNFAYSAARIMKQRNSDIVSFDELADLLRNCGLREKMFFEAIQKQRW